VPHLKRGDTMIVIDVARLLGRDGILPLLRARGFRIDRVRSAAKKAPLWSGSTEPLVKGK